LILRDAPRRSARIASQDFDPSVDQVEQDLFGEEFDAAYSDNEYEIYTESSDEEPMEEVNEQFEQNDKFFKGKDGTLWRKTP
jgi:hypothetical protein